MPHIIIEYSANLESNLDMQEIIDGLHQTALETGVFPLGGLRTRAARREQFRIADGHRDNTFIHVILKIGSGRDYETKKRAFDQMSGSLSDLLKATFASTPIGISIELVEIDPKFTYKLNNLHEYVKDRTSD
ncbi:MAG: 5-carboxymethyl-2-hydroxymuconate isomerase [Parasphingorhabdus sp.]|jgi:5-carboxymethyl-2-hydroxymuconate isomerase